MRSILFTAGLWLCLVCAPLGPARAQTGPDPLAQAEAALAAQDPARAEALADAYSPASRAQADRRLWIVALARLRQGQVAAAIPLLERLAALHPDVTRLRLELARAYFLTGRDGAARRSFESARAGGLNPDEDMAVTGYLTRIEARRQRESYLTFALQPESNAVRRTAAEIIDIGGLPFVLGPGARARPDTALRVQFGHLELPRLGPGFRGRFGIQGDARLFQDSRLNDVTLRFEAGLEKLVARETPVSFGLLADLRHLGDRPYSLGVGGYLAYATTLGQARAVGGAGLGRFQARIEVMDLRHDTLPFSDGRRSSLTLGYRHALSSSLVLTMDAALSRMDARARSESGTTRGIGLGFDKAFEGGLGLSGRLGVSEMDRDAPSGLFAVARRDRLNSLSLNLTHRGWDLGGFAPVIGLSAEHRRSTIALYDYRNYGLSLGLTRRF